MSEVFDWIAAINSYIWTHLWFINVILSIVIVFFQRKDPKSVWAWLLLLYFIPVLGFVFYLLIGTDTHKQRMFRIKEIEDQLNQAIRQQENALNQIKKLPHHTDISGYEDLILYNLDAAGAIISDDNEVTFYTDGREKFQALMEDMRQAKESIHIQYYIIRNDELFQEMVEIMIKKAAEGVEVRVLFDAMGCRSVKHKYWKWLEKQGIVTAEFFPALLRRLHLRMNYRNHRKIAVIDGEIGYVGGFNIGREYLGLDKKFGYWRDTHMRITGTAVQSLQVRFILDWNYAAKNKQISINKYLKESVSRPTVPCDIQIVTNGPDSQLQNIRNTYLRMIGKAKKCICIQTPYFIPDEPILSALVIAVYSGIEVKIMIPCKPDHPFVYWATYSYVGELVMAGAKCYTYDNGFLHAKGMIIDEEILCYGTTNMDIRSFSLNFEVNAVIYSREKAGEMMEIYNRDLENCTRITKEMYLGRKVWIRLKEQFSRLLSPLL